MTSAFATTLHAATPERINIVTFGSADATAATDSTAALCDAIAQANVDTGAGYPASIYLPTGTYVVSTSTDSNCAQGFLPPFAGNAGVVGDGPHKSYILLTSAYQGNLFSWSNAYRGTAYSGSSVAANQDTAGAMVKGLTILGNSASGPIQNAFMIYNLTDYLLMEDVEVQFLTGRCLGMGLPKGNASGANVDESKFYNIRFNNCGTTSSLQFNGTMTSGSATISGIPSAQAAMLSQNMSVQGTGIPPGAFIAAPVSGTSITISTPATASLAPAYLTAGQTFQATTIINSPVITETASPTTPLVAGMRVYGPGIPAGAMIVGLSGSSITLSANALATITTAELVEVQGVAFNASFPSGSTTIAISGISPGQQIGVGMNVVGVGIPAGAVITSYCPAISSGCSAAPTITVSPVPANFAPETVVAQSAR